ncbi:MAG: ankyrin repeat domain-containing protein [Candidatus Sericytochromatia bacterium]
MIKLKKLVIFSIYSLVLTSCANNLIANKNIDDSIINYSSLITAVESNDTNKTKSLLSNGISSKIKNSKGQTLLMMASQKGNQEIVKLICKNALDEIINDTNISNTEKILDPFWLKNKYQEFLNYTDSNKKTSLVYAIENKNNEVAEYLINMGSDINVLTSEKDNLLLLATEKDLNVNVIKLLIEKGLDVNSISKDGNSPLCYASFNGNKEVVKLLISKNANVNNINGFKNSPLLLASFFEKSDLKTNYDEIISILIENKADPNILNNNSDSLISLAIENSDISTLDKITNKIKYDKNILDKEGNNLFLIASKKGNDAILEELLKIGYSIDSENYNGDNGINLAIKNKKINTAFFLKSKNIDIRHKNKNGEDSLQLSVLNDTNGSMIELASTLISKDIKKEELKTLIDISYNQLKERYGYYYLFAYEPNSINYFLRDKYSSM